MKEPKLYKFECPLCNMSMEFIDKDAIVICSCGKNMKLKEKNKRR